jgi:hypothetical protein
VRGQPGIEHGEDDEQKRTPSIRAEGGSRVQEGGGGRARSGPLRDASIVPQPQRQQRENKAGQGNGQEHRTPPPMGRGQAPDDRSGDDAQRRTYLEDAQDGRSSLGRKRCPEQRGRCRPETRLAHADAHPCGEQRQVAGRERARRRRTAPRDAHDRNGAHSAPAVDKKRDRECAEGHDHRYRGDQSAQLELAHRELRPEVGERVTTTCRSAKSMTRSAHNKASAARGESERGSSSTTPSASLGPAGTKLMIYSPIRSQTAFVDSTTSRSIGRAAPISCRLERPTNRIQQRERSTTWAGRPHPRRAISLAQIRSPVAAGHGGPAAMAQCRRSRPAARS